MDPDRQKQLASLAQKLGVKGVSLKLLNSALTHPSYANENSAQKLEHNQRLEFLGDAVINLAVGEYLYRAFPTSTEGELTRRRAVAVCSPALAEAARRMNLGDYLLLGRGEELSGGRERDSLLADTFEAVVGALYLSLGWESVFRRVTDYLQFDLVDRQWNLHRDYKTSLQELVQRRTGRSVNYAVLQESGPDHRKHFKVGAFLRGKVLGQGEGRTKKEAEQQAARAALERGDLEELI